MKRIPKLPKKEVKVVSKPRNIQEDKAKKGGIIKANLKTFEKDKRPAMTITKTLKKMPKK